MEEMNLTFQKRCDLFGRKFFQEEFYGSKTERSPKPSQGHASSTSDVQALQVHLHPKVYFRFGLLLNDIEELLQEGLFAFEK